MPFSLQYVVLRIIKYIESGKGVHVYEPFSLIWSLLKHDLSQRRAKGVIVELWMMD